VLFKLNQEIESFCSYPEVVEGEVCETHPGDVFGQLIQDLRILCLKRGESIYFIPAKWSPENLSFCYRC
jgi:hypothetical protein